MWLVSIRGFYVSTGSFSRLWLTNFSNSCMKNILVCKIWYQHTEPKTLCLFFLLALMFGVCHCVMVCVFCVVVVVCVVGMRYIHEDRKVMQEKICRRSAE